MSLMEATGSTQEPVRSNPGRIQGKLKQACQAMAWEGMHYDDAARKVNLSVYAMRQAIAKQHVQAYIRQQRQVFRASLVDPGLRRMVELSEQNDNLTAAVAATRTLLNETDQSDSNGSQRSAPGLVVVIQTSPNVGSVGGTVIDVTNKPIKSDTDGG